MLIFIFIFIFVVLVIVVVVVKIVLQGYQWMVECFGCFIQMLQLGLSLVVLFMDCIGCKVNMMEQVFDIFLQEVIFWDNVNVIIDVVCFIQVIDVLKVVYEVSNFEQVIVNLMMINICIVFGLMELDEMFFQCDSINICLLYIVDDVINLWGVKIICVEICDVCLLVEFIVLMNVQMKVECIKCVYIFEVEGV